MDERARMSEDQKWDYQFALHPGSRVSMPKYVRALISRSMVMQVETFTEVEFSDFCREMHNAGWELHEVTRVPYFDPEIVRYWL